MEHDFAGKVALVTGGGRGLGKAIAKALAARGCKVTVFARTAAELEQTLAEISAAGGSAAMAAGDIRAVKDVENAVEHTAGVHGGLDILINAAGGFSVSSSSELDPAEWQTMLQTNLIGAFAACAAAGKLMRARGYGRIVNFGSLLSFVAFPERAAYAASKAGVVQMTRVIAVEWARYGITANCIIPGMIAIETPHPLIRRGAIRDEQLLARIPLGRRGVPADVVGPVLFLASDAAGYITGQTLAVDGGWLAYGYV